MKKLLFISILIVSMAVSYYAIAHPGRTASDGCHYCRTNCDKWGVPWNKRHCHGTGLTPDHSPDILHD